MFVKFNKSIILGLLILFVLIIPFSFAADNGTQFLNHHATNETQVLSIPLDENALGASNDYYFDASVEEDGDGSISSPYKYLKADRIKANSNIYLANGEYQLDTSKSIQEVNIIGSDVDRTIIKYDGVAFTVNNELTIKNVTLNGLSIKNNAKFNATNTIFEEGYGSKPDAYGNNFGGAIYTDDGATNAYVNVDNCTFRDNYAIYGGAIYIGAGSLSVSNSLFYNNLAYNYGGAIACEYMGNVSISKSKFYNSSSIADAGGSIYIRASSRFAADYVDIVNSSSTFGGAITTLNTAVSLNYVKMIDNSAKYDGGAIYHMYGNFSLIYSNFNNNSARNGGAIFIDNSTNANLMRNTFTNNRATNTGGAIYSLLNKLNAPLPKFNTFSSNIAAYENNYYDVSKINLTIGDGNYTMYKVDETPITSLPSNYSLISDGYVTPVKDQQSSGNCWAFNSLAVLESCILKATGEKLDLSEENMKNIIALYSDYGWKLDTNEGGYDYMHWGYLAGWLGPVYEIDDPFDDKSTLSSLYNSIMHIQNIKFLKRNSYTDNDEIKKAILNYGAVGAGIYFDSRYYDAYSNTYYCWYTSSGNHAVAIVGWDDTFSKSNFRWGSDIEGDGAWIVRNSWGSSWGDDGYFYVSYYDKNFARPEVGTVAYTYVLNDTIRFDKNYQYDIAGMTDYFINSSSNVWYKNKFTATSDEYLAAVSTYFEKVSNWTATVLVNDEVKDVLSGISDAGYYTFSLNRYIPLKKGDILEVIFNITTSGEAGFPISEIYSLNKLVYAPEISYVSYDGENWADLYNLTWEYSTHTYSSAVACIKAFTFLNPINTLTNLSIDFKQDEPANVTAVVVDEYGNFAKEGNVTFDINGDKKTIGVVNGKAILSYDLNKKINAISATFAGEGYNSSSNITSYELPKIHITWTLNITQSFNNVNITVAANKLVNESIIMDINGENVPFKLINGSNTLPLIDLPNDLYEVHVSLPVDSDYLADILADEFVIDMSSTRIVSDSITANDEGPVLYNVTLFDENDNLIANKEIIFTIGNITYANTTDSYGRAVIFVKLDKGVYEINSSFKGDNNYFPSNASASINVKGKIWINLDINTFKNNAFVNVFGSNHINETFMILVNEENYNVTSKDGIACLKLYNLTNGIYNVTVALNEEEYEFNEAKSQFIINVEDTVEINNDIEISGNGALINVIIENAPGSVNIIVDGVENVVELSEGQANYTLENIAPGNHSLVIAYGSNIKSVIFTVPKKKSNIELSLNDNRIGETSIITVNVTQNATGLVSIDINETSYLINLSETNSLNVILNDIGVYSVVATYLGDDQFNSSTSQEYELTVNDKEYVNVSVGVPEEIKVGENVEFGISGDITDNLEVYIDDEIQEIIDGKINYAALKAGLHIIEIYSAENADYHEFHKTVPFNVVKNNATIIIHLDDTVFVGQTVTINPVTDSDASLIVKVNGEAIDSSYVIPFKGTFVVTVESDETEMYYSAFNSTTITAIKNPSTLNISVVAGKSGEKSKVNVNVTEGATGIVIVNVNGTDYSIDLSKTDVLELTLHDCGEYKVIANYLGDDKFDESQSNPQILIVNDKLAANIDVEIPVDIKVGDEILVNITSDSGAKLIVTINGEVQELISISNSLSSSVKYTPSKKGTYNITVSALENEDYVSGTITKIFEATKKDAILEIVPITNAKIGDKVIVQIVNETDGALTVKINGEIVSGEYEIVKAGSHTVTVVSDATDIYNVGFAYYTFDVEEKPVVIPMSSEFGEITIYDNQSVSIVLKNWAGGVIAYAPIEYVVNGVAGNTTTDGEGKFIIEGVNGAIINIKYGGNDFIVGTNINLTLNNPVGPVVVKVASHFNVSDGIMVIKGYIVDAKAGEEGIYYATELLDAYGNPIKGVKIQLRLNSEVYYRTTNENGSFTPYKLNMVTAGEYTMVLFFAGDDNHAGALATVCFNLSKKTIKIKASAKTLKANKKVKYTITLSTIVGSSHDGKAHLRTGKVAKLKVNGKTYTGKTNKKGKVTFKIKNTKKGKFTATITVNQDTTYKKATKKVKLTFK